MTDTVLSMGSDVSRDYDNIVQFDAGEATTIASGDRIVLQVYNDTPSGYTVTGHQSLYGASWAGDGEIVIEAASGEKSTHLPRASGSTGDYTGAHWRTSGVYTLKIDVDVYVTVQDLILHKTGGAYQNIITFTPATIRRNIIWSDSDEGCSVNSLCTIESNLFIITDVDDQALNLYYASSSNSLVKNNTIVLNSGTSRSFQGFYYLTTGASTVTANNVTYDIDADDTDQWNYDSTPLGTATNNASSDGSHPSTNGQTISSSDFDDAANYDFQPVSSGNLDGTGSNTHLAATDFFGYAWTSDCIGCFQPSTSSPIAISATTPSVSWSTSAATVVADIGISAASAGIDWSTLAASIGLSDTITTTTPSITWVGNSATIASAMSIAPASASVAWSGQSATVGLTSPLNVRAATASITWRTHRSVAGLTNTFSVTDPESLPVIIY